MTAEDTRTVIEIGDFVRSLLNPFICGYAVRVGYAGKQQGKHVVRGFHIERANGSQIFIGERDLELIAKSDAWWVRWQLEHSQPAIEVKP